MHALVRPRQPSLASSSLQALESIMRAIQTSLDGCFTAMDPVKILVVWYQTLCYCDFRPVGGSGKNKVFNVRDAYI